MLFSTRKYWLAMTEKECKIVMAAIRGKRVRGRARKNEIGSTETSEAPLNGRDLHSWLDEQGLSDAEVIWRLHNYAEKCEARWRNQIPKVIEKLSGFSEAR